MRSGYLIVVLSYFALNYALSPPPHIPKVFERIEVWRKGNFSQKVSLSPQKNQNHYFCFFLNCEGDIPVCAFTHFERYLASANDSMSAISFKV